MKFLITNTIFLFFLTLLCCTCDNKPEAVPFYPIPDDSKPYIVFPKGSYWIYEEINSLTIDTVFLYRSETDRVNAATKLGYDYERYTAGYESSLTGDSTRGFGDPFHNDQKIWAYRESNMNSALASLTLIFLNPLPVGESRRYAEDWTLKFESEAESLKVDGVTYSSVKVFKHNVMVFSNQSERAYFSKDVGMIRREQFNGDVWLLKKYFINK
jgi:hypothetical protein